MVLLGSVYHPPHVKVCAQVQALWVETWAHRSDNLPGALEAAGGKTHWAQPPELVKLPCGAQLQSDARI